MGAMSSQRDSVTKEYATDEIVVESGRHEDLIRAGGRYTALTARGAELDPGPLAPTGVVSALAPST